MNIPFSAPQVPELDELSEIKRKEVIRNYTISAKAGRIMMAVHALLISSGLVMIGGLILANTFPDSAFAFRAGGFALSAVLIVGTVTYYRLTVQSTLRKMILLAQAKPDSK